jgi:hypothetical protein
MCAVLRLREVGIWEGMNEEKIGCRDLCECRISTSFIPLCVRWSVECRVRCS